jgi:hypothetical protein
LETIPHLPGARGAGHTANRKLLKLTIHFQSSIWYHSPREKNGENVFDEFCASRKFEHGHLCFMM